jgi:hypothetical protein
MPRFVSILAAAAAMFALAGCDKAAEAPAAPAAPGNLEAGRPPESQAGAYVNEAKKVQETINLRPGQVNEGVKEGTGGSPATP